MWRDMPSFTGIQEDCEEIVTDINHRLETRLQVQRLLRKIIYIKYDCFHKIFVFNPAWPNVSVCLSVYCTSLFIKEKNTCLCFFVSFLFSVCCLFKLAIMLPIIIIYLLSNLGPRMFWRAAYRSCSAVAAAWNIDGHPLWQLPPPWSCQDRLNYK